MPALIPVMRGDDMRSFFRDVAHMVLSLKQNIRWMVGSTRVLLYWHNLRSVLTEKLCRSQKDQTTGW
jgi:hypothetical protein